MRRRPPRSTPLYSSAASDVYKRQARGLLRPSSGLALDGNGSAKSSGLPNQGDISVDRRAFAALPEALRNRLIRLGYASLVGETAIGELGLAHVQAARRAVDEGRTGVTIELPGRVR